MLRLTVCTVVVCSSLCAIALLTWSSFDRTQAQAAVLPEAVPRSAERYEAPEELRAGTETRDLRGSVRERASTIADAESEWTLQVWSLADDAPAQGARLKLDGVSIEPSLVGGSRYLLPAREDDGTIEVEAPGLFPTTIGVREALALEPRDGVRRIVLRALGRLVVQALDSEGRSVAGAFVEVMPIDPLTGGRARDLPRPWPVFARDRLDAGAASRFMLPGITAVDGSLEVPALPCGQRLLLTAKLGTDVLRREVTIDSSTRSARVVVDFASSTSIIGTLRWSDGSPASAVLVRLSNCDPAGSDTLHHPSDAQGRFVFRDVPRGCFLWCPQVPGAEPRVVEVASAEHDLGTVLLPRPSIYSGRVLAASLPAESRLEGLEVLATRAGIELDRTRTNPDGRFEIRSPYEDVALEVRAMGRGSLPHDHVGLLEAPLELNVDLQCGSIRFEVGRCEGPDIVELRPRDGRAAIQIIAERGRLGVEMHGEGGYTLHLIPAGTHALRVTRADGSSAWQPELDVPRLRTVVAEELDFGSGSVGGRIVDADGMSLEGVRVSLVEEPRMGSASPRRATSDGEGRFRFDGVPPGLWRVAPTAAEGDSHAGATVRVESGRPAEVDLAVSGVGELVGRIRTTAGSVPPTLRLLPGGAGWTVEPLAVLEPDAAGSFGPVVLTEGSYVLGTSFRNSQGRLVEHWREVEIGAGTTSSVDFVLPAAVELAFLSRGEPLSRVADGYVCFPGGQATIARLDGEAYQAAADLPSGPWLFAVRTLEDRDPVATRRMRGFVLALVSDRPIHEGRLDVELSSGSLRVSAGPRAELAEGLTCDLIGLRSEVGILPYGFRLRLRGRVTEDGDALFEHLPQGARLRVRGPDGAGGITALDVELASTTLVVPWPPRTL